MVGFIVENGAIKDKKRKLDTSSERIRKPKGA
jgi:hypothetical protein